MRQVDIDSYNWDTTSEAGDINYHNVSLPVDSRVIKRSSTMQTQQYSTSSRESSCSDERSTPSPDFPNPNDETQERSSSLDEAAPNFLAFRLDHSFPRRKVSTSSSTSSTNSTCLSLDGGGSESERNSSCYNADFEVTQIGINKYDDIIEKIVELRFSQKNLNVETKDSSIAKATKRNEEDSFLKLSENVSSRINEDEVLGKEKKIVKGFEMDDVNGNYEVARDKKTEYHDEVRNENDDDGAGEHDESDDDDLVERGPVRPHGNDKSRHGKPYYTLDWLAGTGQNIDQNQSYTPDYDSTAEQILRNKQFSEKLNPCLDKLSDYGRSNRGYFDIGGQSAYGNLNAISGWSSPEVNYTLTDTPNSNVSGDDASNAPIPSIVLNDPGESSLLEILANGGFQPAQALSDTASIQNPSPGTTSSENWPDSPASSYNVLSSCSHSGASSRAQSPGSSANVGSPMLHLNMVGSPAESQPNMRGFRIGQTLSSSESSNHSFGDTPSPSSYQCGVDQRVEEQLDLDFGSFSTWCQSCMSSGTVVNSAETIDAIDNNELQLVEEVIRRDQSEKGNKIIEDMQVVPKSQSLNGDYETETNCLGQSRENDLLSSVTRIRRNCGQRRTIENIFDDAVVKPGAHKESKLIETRLNSAVDGVQQNQFYLPVDVPQLGNTGLLISTAQNNLVSPDLNDVYNLMYSDDMQNSNLYNDNPLNSAESLMDFENSMENFLAPHYADSSAPVVSHPATNDSSTAIHAVVNLGTGQLNDFTKINESQNNCFDDTTRKTDREASKSTFNEFQIPETVSSYRQNRSKRTSERNIAPWPSLNLPLTGASERLKAGLNPRDVEKAMKNLLKRPTEELAAGDEDGDTMLMCLVGNPLELEKKKAYLVPLVERLGSVSGALTMTNNRSEDALYLAAINCPQMAYVTGYLAAAMIQRGIDVSQRLYHTRGDTLIHAIAAKGDSHGAVLAELLSLKTVQGNSVFDLSKRNYDGRTPLHVAMESHDPTGSGVNCIGSTRLLLENGANQKIKETKCGDTALHIAVSLYCDPALVKVLLSKNGHEAVNMPNYNNNTPVHMASALSKAVPIERQMEVCMDLIRAGGLTNIQNRQGKTPLALVSAERKEAIRHIFHKKV